MGVEDAGESASQMHSYRFICEIKNRVSFVLKQKPRFQAPEADLRYEEFNWCPVTLFPNTHAVWKDLSIEFKKGPGDRSGTDGDPETFRGWAERLRATMADTLGEKWTMSGNSGPATLFGKAAAETLSRLVLNPLPKL